ncbi:LysR family transcriptional regulator [Pseudonocardia ailaonensis]|uniref:LysR family transcriptional regulator n=1 Tax=Pseudonocardia ailaonensis TaxID=367279 RepID=A0ABN2NBJ7_9PSEU
MLDVNRLRVLVAVARLSSVTAAAQELRYAQPSVSHHLQRLEAETGSKLTQRAGRGIRLTDAGRMLAARAEEILARLEAAEAELAAYAGLRAGRVRLAAFPSALSTIVARAAASLLAEHPAIELRLIEAEPPEAVRLLRAGEVDIALLFAYENPTTGEDSVLEADDENDLRRVSLLREPTYLITRKGAGGRTLADFAGQRWVGGCERCRAHLLRACARVGFVPDIRIFTDDYVAVQSLVAAGLGVATLPALALAAQQHPEVRAMPLPHHDRQVVAAVHGRAPDPPATAALLGHLVAAGTVSRSVFPARPAGGTGTASEV